MEIKCKSWRSQWQSNRISDNPHSLVKCNIAEIRPSNHDGVHWWELEGNVLIRAENDGVLMQTGAKGLSMRGDYFITIQLTKTEIINLVKIAWENNEFLDALSRS
ncbi:MAG: hypothetical protein DMG65_06560 [Candidatus Angelobacter sp. Gp1-AA117]|nr:MAG: hypothetical protein DMG65_06560 [Candidatus Angelobacter sp. Gp1-AA117]